MIRFIYNLLWPIGILVFLPRYLVKMFRRGNYREKFWQRFGIYDAGVRQRLAQQRSTWLHAVSVGEVGIALRLAAELRKLESDLRCVLTTTTTTGFAFANRNAPEWMEVMYNPLDFWPIVRRAFAAIDPKRLLLIEAEVWPNLVAEAHRRGIPIVLANARLSPRSEKRFQRFRFIVAPIFRLLDLICIQEPNDINRWTALGVVRERIRCTGSIKFDPRHVTVDLASAESVLRQCKIDNQRPILLAGSTHPGEEEILGKIFIELRKQFPDLSLIIAPRHAERANEIRRMLQQLGLNVALRSESAGNAVPDCLILDSTGELQNWYAIATVVFVGKSLAAHGGQNPVEAIAAGKPVLFGEHMENFAALARELVERHGAVQVQSANELKEKFVDLLRDRELRKNLVENARGVLEKHRGATASTAKLIVDLG
jgi:3-deoxy-D-manno-octulosonic-acid transferase